MKPSDTSKESFKKLELAPSTRVEKLKTQLRVRGGNKYIKLIHKIFDAPSTLSLQQYKTDDYELYLFDNLSQMINRIKEKNELHGLSRIVAGYAWEWVSNKNTEAYDIVIGENQLKWNSISVDWVNSPNSIDEVGCIHTTQGYDLNYTGVIIGPELDYDFTSGKLTVDKQRYKDKNGKNSIKNEEELLDFIINIYKTILLRGIEGTYIYACNENLRRFLQQFIPPYAPSSNEEKLIQISNTPTESSIPFYDLNIAAGSFSELQELENVKYIELDSLENRDDYFACTVIGESMNKIIPNGSICLFKKYSGGSRNGLITLVEGRNITDLEFGSNYTIKEYSSKKITDEEGWHHEEIVLLPQSYDSNFEPIILRDEETIDFKTLGIFVKVLKK
nr:DNA/RNA helicase domain-containing protein [Chryseobacterium sp. PCH239]